MPPGRDSLDIIRGCMKVALELDEAETQAIGVSTTAADLEKWTSSTQQALVLELESRFGIEFDVLEIVDLVSVDAIARAVDGRRR